MFQLVQLKGNSSTQDQCVKRRERVNYRHRRAYFGVVHNWLVERAPSGRLLIKRRACLVLVIFLVLIPLIVLIIAGSSNFGATLARNLISELISIARKNQDFPSKCTTGDSAPTCQNHYPSNTYNQTSPNHQAHLGPSNLTCPSYFRWIHEDLRPWKETGISRAVLERAQREAHFRLVIVDGKVYVKKYRHAIQSRDIFTLWGVLQLLRWYPGRVPDLELLFNCKDRPAIMARDYVDSRAGPPPLFKYCGDEESLDIVFPDWSFWGWAETNIRPWNSVLKDIEEGNERTKWENRRPYAFWRGNPYVTPTRKDLMKCNVSDGNDWNTRLYIQDWSQEATQGYRESSLKDQCDHRYKIYVEGWAWSVSEKYILACNSVTLYVRSKFYTFYERAMVPLKHYWPIRDTTKCSSLKFAVDWGNNHTQQAEAIGEAGSRFMHEQVKMEHVYDYMFHLLSSYAKLLRTKPTVPRGAIELCPETMACLARDVAAAKANEFMEESLVRSPRYSSPCNLPPPYDPNEMREFLDRKAESIRRVEIWEAN